VDNLAVVKRAVEGILARDFQPLLDLSVEHVFFRRVSLGPQPVSSLEVGRQRMVEYFETLGGIVSFWQVKFRVLGEQVLVLGNESFTTDGGIEGSSDFALVVDACGGLITALLVVEDLPALSGDLKRFDVPTPAASRSREPLSV
jgi:hypothetical protein